MSFFKEIKKGHKKKEGARKKKEQEARKKKEQEARKKKEQEAPKEEEEVPKEKEEESHPGYLTADYFQEWLKEDGKRRRGKMKLLLYQTFLQQLTFSFVKYDMCVCCPVCSQPESVKCRDHNVRGCDCLHFLSESDLRERQHCKRPGRFLPRDCRIRIQQFKCWFLFGEEEEGARMSTNQQLQALHATSHRGSFSAKGIFSVEGTKRKDLALPESIKTSIQSIPLNSASDVKDIVIQFREALQLEPASLVSPEPETRIMIRGLTLRAKSEKRDDLVRHLREITPAGTTGPLLNDDMSVDCMPHEQYKDLTFSLSVRGRWKLLADRLGFSQIEMCFLDERVVNPADVVLGAVAKHRHLSVGEIYDTLVDCELPVVADLI